MAEFELNLTVDEPPTQNGESAPAVAASQPGLLDKPLTPPPAQPLEPLDPAVAAFLNRIKPVTEFGDLFYGLFYGEPGVGKTVLAASSPNTLVLDCDHSSESLKNHAELRDTQILPMEEFSDVNKVIWAIRKGHLPWVETLVVDNFTYLQARALDELVAAKAGTALVPTQPDYQLNTKALRKILIELYDLPINKVVTTHVEKDKDGIDGHLILRPAVTPKLAETMDGIFSLIGFLWVERNEKGATRYLQVEPNKLIKAKSRIGGLPNVIPNPTMSMLLAANKSRKGR